MGWIKGSPVKPTRAEILEQCEYWREVIEDLRDFPIQETRAIAEWASERVQAGSAKRTLTAQNRSNGGKKKALRARQRNFGRDAQILALHRQGLSARAISDKTGVSKSQVARVVKREKGND